MRSFPIYRESDLEFRVEYFDVLNHPIFSDPTVNPTSTAYGEITKTQASAGLSPRLAQFSLKFLF